MLLLFASHMNVYSKGVYGINGYNLYGPKMTRVEICGTEVIIGREGMEKQCTEICRDMLIKLI